MRTVGSKQADLWPVVFALALVAGIATASMAMQGDDRGPGQGRQCDMMDEGPGGMPGCGMGMGMGMAEDLKLTADQKDQLKADRLTRAKRLIALRAEAQILKLDLREAEDEDKPDLGRIQSLANKLGQIHAKQIVERAKGRVFFLGLLTPEQKKTFEEGRGQGRHERGPHAPGTGPDEEN
jgi:Spy/CpxP family protein refolding chaperone